MRRFCLVLFLTCMLCSHVGSVDINNRPLIFAHYFPPYPVSLDNFDSVSDSYAKDFLNPAGQGGRFMRLGGYLNDRPLPKKPGEPKTWKVENLASEIRAAKSIGIDGFVIDIMGHDAVFDSFFSDMLSAIALENSDFKLMLMPDMEALWGRNKERMADLVCKYGSLPAVLKINSKIVLSPYNAESYPVKKDNENSPIDSNWWRDLVNNKIPEKCSMEVFFVPLFQGVEKYAANYADFSEGFSDWGPRDIEQLDNFFAMVDRLKNRYPEKIFFFPIAAQDARPKSATYWEADGISLLQRSLDKAVQINSPWLHVITWNDYSENTQFSPSCKTGFGYYRYLARSLDKNYTKDEILFFHRRRVVASEPTIGIAWSRAIGKKIFSENITVVAFLRSAGTIELTIGGTVFKKKVDSGFSKIRFPLASGIPQLKLVRNGETVVSAESVCQVRESLDYDDFEYCAGSSSEKVSLIAMPACALWAK